LLAWLLAGATFFRFDLDSIKDTIPGKYGDTANDYLSFFRAFC
jgi:hypothetical protein